MHRSFMCVMRKCASCWERLTLLGRLCARLSKPRHELCSSMHKSRPYLVMYLTHSLCTMQRFPRLMCRDAVHPLHGSGVGTRRPCGSSSLVRPRRALSCIRPLAMHPKHYMRCFMLCAFVCERLCCLLRLRQRRATWIVSAARMTTTYFHHHQHELGRRRDQTIAVPSQVLGGLPSPLERPAPTKRVLHVLHPHQPPKHPRHDFQDVECLACNGAHPVVSSLCIAVSRKCMRAVALCVMQMHSRVNASTLATLCPCRGCVQVRMHGSLNGRAHVVIRRVPRSLLLRRMNRTPKCVRVLHVCTPLMYWMSSQTMAYLNVQSNACMKSKRPQRCGSGMTCIIASLVPKRCASSTRDLGQLVTLFRRLMDVPRTSFVRAHIWPKLALLFKATPCSACCPTWRAPFQV